MKWPYDDVAAPEPPPTRPRWSCPGGECECHPAVSPVDEPVILDLVLRDMELNRMAGAVCLVESPDLEGDALLKADGEGRVRLTFRRDPGSIVLSWAPGTLPSEYPFPYRKVFFVDLREQDPDEAAARRLHNLGFSSKGSLADNVAEFERSFGHTLTAELDEARPALELHHEGTADPLRAEEPNDIGSGANVAHFGPDVDPKPTADPATKSRDRRVGCAADVPAMPSPMAVFSDLIFEFTPIESKHGGYKATFWVFRDALKWAVPFDFFPLWYRPPHSSDPIHGEEMLCRLPGTAQQHEAVARKITTTPRMLAGDSHPDEPARSSLQMTTKLYDLRWAQADCQVAPHPQSTARCMFLESKKMNVAINDEANAKSASPRIVADAGKAWVIVHQVNKVRAIDNDHFAGFNYGWHKPSGTVVQGPGNQHCACHHVDYSQLCYLVAGHCLIEGNEFKTPTWVRTEAIYTTKAHCGLAVAGGTPLTDVRYRKFGPKP